MLENLIGNWLWPSFLLRYYEAVLDAVFYILSLLLIGSGAWVIVVLGAGYLAMALARQEIKSRFDARRHSRI